MKFRVFAPCLLLISPAFAGNIVINPGFETGSAAPWVTNPSAGLPWIVQASQGRNPNGAFEGTYYLNTGCVGSQCTNNDIDAQSPVGSWVYQDLITTPDTFYTLSFEFSSAGQPGQELQVLWGGSVVLDLMNLNAGPYNLYTVGELGATSEITRLEFIGRQDPGYNGLDAVCVSSSTDCTAAVPEPATLFQLGGGFSLIGALFLVRKRASKG